VTNYTGWYGYYYPTTYARTYYTYPGYSYYVWR